MRKTISLLALLLFATTTVAADFDAFFEEFAARREGITSLKARFTETSIVPDDVFESEGTLVFAQPRRIVRRTLAPFETTFLVDGMKAYQHEPEVAQVVVADLEEDPQAEIIFLGFQSDAAALRDAFDITLFEVNDDMRGTRGLRLIPKTDESERLFQEVQLYLRDEDYLPYRVVIETDEESRMILDVSNFDVNCGLSADDTQLALPEGTRVIVDDAVLEVVGEGGRKVPQPIVVSVDDNEVPEETDVTADEAEDTAKDTEASEL